MEVESSATKLEQIINTKDKQLVTLQKELLKNQRTTQTLKTERDTFSDNLSQKENLIKDLTSLKDQAEAAQRLTSLDSINYKREAELYDQFLQTNLAKSDYFIKTIKQLDTELRAKLEAIKDLDKQNAFLVRENSSFQELDSFFKKKEEIYKTTIEDLFGELNTYHQAAQEKTTRIEAKLEAEQRESERIRISENNLRQRVGSLETSIKETQGDKNIELRNVQRALDLSLALNKNLKQDLEILREELKAKRGSYEEKDQEVFRTFEEKSKKIESLHQEIHDLKLQIVEKDANFSRISEENRRLTAKDTLLNQGFEEFQNQQEVYNDLSKENLLEHLGKMMQIIEVERNDKLKLTTQLSEIRKDLSEKIPILLEKQAQFSKASEENDVLRSRIDKFSAELDKVYNEKVTLEREIERRKENEQSLENFDAAFLSNQVTKLLIQNNKLKLAITQAGGTAQQVEAIIGENREAPNSVFYRDIEDLQEKHRMLVKRVKELKGVKETKPDFLQGKRLSKIEEDEDEDVVSSPEDQDSRRLQGKEVIEKKIKSEKSEVQARAEKQAQEGVIKNLNREILDLKNKIREMEQINIAVTQELNFVKSEQTKVDAQSKNQAALFENNLNKFQSNENEVKRLVQEREDLKKKLTEKDRIVSEHAAKAEAARKEKANLEHKLTILQKELANRKDFEDRLNKAIQNAQQPTTMLEETSEAPVSIDSLQTLREDNILLKAKVETQSVLLKSHENRELSLKNLLAQVSQQFQTYSDKLQAIFFVKDVRESYNSPTQEVSILRGKLHELQETLAFYREELYSQTIEYQQAFDKIEKMASVITEKFGSLNSKFIEQGAQLKDQLTQLTTDYETKLQGLNTQVDKFIESNEEEEVYEDTDWKHISEYQALEEKLKKEEENSKLYKDLVDEVRDQLLQERETNLKYTRVQQQENEQIKQYIVEIDRLVTEKARLENSIAGLNRKLEESTQKSRETQETFERDILELSTENKTLRQDLERMTENLSQVTSTSTEQAGIVAFEQQNNLLAYLREKNGTLAFERDQLKSQLATLRKKINALKDEKANQVDVLENELTNLKYHRELETVPQTDFLKILIEENKNLLKDNKRHQKILSEQERQLQIYDRLRKEQEDQSKSPDAIEEEEADLVNAEKLLLVLEKAKAQYEVLGKIDGKDEK